MGNRLNKKRKWRKLVSISKDPSLGTRYGRKILYSLILLEAAYGISRINSQPISWQEAEKRWSEPYPMDVSDESKEEINYGIRFRLKDGDFTIFKVKTKEVIKEES